MLSWQIAVPGCLKDSEPIIRVQVPWRVCERLAAGEGGQGQKEDDGHSLRTAWLANVPHPLVTRPAGGSGLLLSWCFHGPPCVWTFLVPLKLSLSMACGPRLGDLPGLAERVGCKCGSGVKPSSSSTSCGSHPARAAAGIPGSLFCWSCVT